ncbi:hypothetical protein SYJ56_23540 [Algoriphagus sp. D3-2-R+10]|uniref:hypothetical protein n=1 Tax=Algoriphagus aurantiacus TaxID=3103948 RepID=UPI002B395138|nr:hypothetical protein [Algoriphagus sp. D3-2-R+10]MEB2778304.1 hypothetical protein [Algoriphagus sp. D3-2-R+10]
MVPEDLVKHTCLYPFVLTLEIAEYGLANAEKKEDKDYSAEQIILEIGRLEIGRLEIGDWRLEIGD